MVVLWHFYLTRFHCGCCQHAACCLLCTALALGFEYLQSSCGESLTAEFCSWWLLEDDLSRKTRESSLVVARDGRWEKKLIWVKCAFVMDTRLITWNEMKIPLSLFRDCLNFPVRPVVAKNRSTTAPVWIITRLNLIGIGRSLLKERNWIPPLSRYILRLCCEALDAQMTHISSKKDSNEIQG